MISIPTKTLRGALLGIALLLLLSGASTPDALPAPAPQRLWSTEAPGAHGTTDNDIPTLAIYLPDPAKATGAAMVVCPGGGYSHLAPHEGDPICRWLNSLGITAGLLKYRLGSCGYRYPAEFLDGQRALRTLRANAAQWNLDPHRIGIIGFSAGGHLASTVTTHYDAGNPDAPDPIDRVSSRPDLALLLYPVITMGDLTHKGSRTELLGANPDPKLVELLSNEKHVTPQTPPCFLVATADDATVPVENSIMFALACRKNKVPFEIHIFQHGKHGFGLGTGDPELSTWPADAANFMAHYGFLTATPAKAN